MPYEIRQNGESYEVINSSTKKVKVVHSPPDAKNKAQRQAELLNEIEKDPRWEEKYA